MRNFKMIIQYDGSRYQGWQRLKDNDNTIQGKLEQVLTRFQDNGKMVEVIGSGRTDAGVHSQGQVANAHLETQETPESIQEYMNHYLPDDIAVISLQEVDERFHSRFQAKGKTYCYRILNGTVPDVFERKYLYTLEQPLDVEAMKRAADYFIGSHDFQAFTTTKRSKKSTVREIYNIRIEEKQKGSGSRELDFYFDGEGFLYNMVRILMGTLIEVGLGKRTPESMELLLQAVKREQTGYLVPGKGLCLLEVRY